MDRLRKLLSLLMMMAHCPLLGWVPGSQVQGIVSFGGVASGVHLGPRPFFLLLFFSYIFFFIVVAPAVRLFRTEDGKSKLSSKR